MDYLAILQTDGGDGALWARYSTTVDGGQTQAGLATGSCSGSRSGNGIIVAVSC